MINIIEKVDESGRIQLPEEYRKSLQLESGTEVIISKDSDVIKMERLNPICYMCKSTENVDRSLKLCSKCFEKLSKHIKKGHLFDGTVKKA